jgi:uncharacterized Fe-S cluster-containing radical SAM superfamily protein
MAKYKVLEGVHVVSNEPLVMASVGEIVDSDRDLVAVFGDQKFAKVEDSVAADEPKKKGPKAE